MRKSIALLAIVLSPFAAPAASLGATIFESFEDGFGPWRPNADIALGYRIVPSQDQAEDGSWSIEMTGNGLNDDGTLWIVRELQVGAGSWDVELDLFGWSASDGMVNALPAIGFIGLFEPQTEEDFTQSSEGENLGALDTAGWKAFHMERTVGVQAPSTIYVALGYNIVYETIVTHYFDSVTITGVPLQCGDGQCFGGENACNCTADCGPPPAIETACTDGADDDCDGLVDCVDSDCSAEPACAGVVCDADGQCDPDETSCDCAVDCGHPEVIELVCDDELDNDCDGAIDCDDWECGGSPACFEPPACDADGVCEAGENCTNCAIDCIGGGGPSCGNGTCEAADGEDCLSCPADCNGKQSGNPSRRFCCGDGGGEQPVSCADPRCTESGFQCTEQPATAFCCGDGTCEGAEDGFNCELDCGAPPTCGDGACDPGEDACGCAADCGAPPPAELACDDGADEDCDGAADCADADCAADPVCQPPGCDGDFVCEPGEDCQSCPSDCDGKLSGPPSQRYCCGNGVLEDPEGDGTLCDGNP